MMINRLIEYHHRQGTINKLENLMHPPDGRDTFNLRDIEENFGLNEYKVLMEVTKEKLQRYCESHQLPTTGNKRILTIRFMTYRRRQVTQGQRLLTQNKCAIAKQVNFIHDLHLRHKLPGDEIDIQLYIDKEAARRFIDRWNVPAPGSRAWNQRGTEAMRHAASRQ